MATRAEREREKKASLLAAAEEVFTSKGYTDATLDEIIKLADTGKGTVYRYFGNKENLFYQLVLGKPEHARARHHRSARHVAPPQGLLVQHDVG